MAHPFMLLEGPLARVLSDLYAWGAAGISALGGAQLLVAFRRRNADCSPHHSFDMLLFAAPSSLNQGSTALLELCNFSILLSILLTELLLARPSSTQW